MLKGSDSEVRNGIFWIVSLVTGILFYITLLSEVPVDSTVMLDTSDVSISVAYYIENALPTNASFLYYVILVMGVLSFFIPLGTINGITLVVLSMVLDKTIVISQIGSIEDVVVVVGSTSIMILMGVIMIVLGLLQLLAHCGIRHFIGRKMI